MQEKTINNNQEEAVPEIPKQKDKGKMIWMVVAIVVIIALIGVVVYGYMQMTKLNNEITSQKAQISDLQNTKKTLEDAASAAATAATNAAANAVGSAINGQTDSQQFTNIATTYCGALANGKAELAKPVRSAINGSYAEVSLICSGSQDGPTAVLKKVNNTWFAIVIKQGLPNEIVSDEVRKLYAIPAGIPTGN